MPQWTFNPGLTLTGFRTTRPRCLGPSLWAKLSIGLRTAPSLNSFMRNIRKILLSGLENNSKAGFTLRLTPEGFQNAPLCLRSALPSTLIRHENRAFRKRSSVRRKFQNAHLTFSCGQKTSWKQTFPKSMKSQYSGMWFSNTDPDTIIGDRSFF